MGDWNMFFATTAGSAATLVGLLFVATQLHLGALADPRNRWAALAQSTLTILSTAFVLSASFLIPMLSPQVRGEIILPIVVVALWRTIRIWWPVVRLTETGRAHRLGQSFWLLLAPVVILAYLLTGAVAFLRGDSTAVFNVGGTMLGLFAMALRNAWRLVVSVEREIASSPPKIPQTR
ncbi:MAG TPA: hypothetical protein VF956_02530 [Candidatus Dormibacteraeota bacterium]